MPLLVPRLLSLCLALCPALFLSLFMLAACDRVPVVASDLEGARLAMQQRDWPLAERLLERYLRGEENAQQRWEAWMRLVEIYSRINLEPDHALISLENMLQEFEADEEKSKLILLRLAEIYESRNQSSQALAAWERYAGLDGLSDQEAANAQRKLGSLHFRQGRFELAEDALQVCLALPVDEAFRAWCLYDLALADMAREMLDDALDQATRVLSMKADDELRGLAGFLLADVLEQQGKLPEALTRFEAVRSLYPNSLVVDNRIVFLKKKLKLPLGSSKQ